MMLQDVIVIKRKAKNKEKKNIAYGGSYIVCGWLGRNIASAPNIALHPTFYPLRFRPLHFVPGQKLHG